MANYQCAVRTNYFHVQDPELFRQFMARVYGTDGSVELWEDKDENDQPVFAFGSYGGIGGLRDAAEDTSIETDETAYDEFICGLQHHVEESRMADKALGLTEAQDGIPQLAAKRVTRVAVLNYSNDRG